MKATRIAYLAIVALLCLAPSAGLLLGGAEVSSDADSAPAPKLVDDGGAPNVNVLADAGRWFDDHFAFRNEWVTAAAKVASVFGVSTNESVVLGTDGWLYYGDSVDDYQDLDQLNDRQLFDIAHSMKLAQTYAQSRGIAFACAIAPNKNTLYGEHMPYYLRVRTGDSALTRIKGVFESEGVNYVDLRTLLADEGEVIYHARDSHWNNVGAALVSDALLTALGHDHASYVGDSYEVRRDFEGDLDKMLFPAAATPEDEAYFEWKRDFTYETDDPQGNFAPKIETESDAAGSLVMYRDSFGNSLLPFMAQSYGKAYFSRGIPYQLVIDLDEHDADALVVERAQRFMRSMAANPPMMPAPMVFDEAVSEGGFVDAGQIEELRQGDYLLVRGSVASLDLADDSRIAVRVNGNLVYEAFGVSDEETGEEGFQLLVPLSVLRADGNEFELALW